ncbi:MAG: hypothetical protein COT15_01955 [Candidatus Diapherotrites archaeon CG08_land_8_20_14_0_20_34_12]|nr:MAG: hypothetical protein COT15_01955 [Candidatus Diapherotrites archaeon CG08_land_8_20_14_0_20_34_12]
MSDELSELLGLQSKIKSKVIHELLDIKENSQILVIETNEDMQTVRKEIVLSLTNSYFSGVYFTTNMPAETLQADLKVADIDINKLQFIDSITKESVGDHTEDTKTVTYLESPTQLSDLNILIERALSRLQGSKKFVFVDSVTTLLIYNQEKSVEKLIHRIVEKNRLKKIVTVILVTKSTNQELIQCIAQFCDKIITI